MERRTFVATLAGGFLAGPLPVEAQLATKVARIGYLATSLTGNRHGREAFRQGLRNLGYVEGRNVVIEYRDADGKIERLPALTAELIALKVPVAVDRPVIHAEGGSQTMRRLMTPCQSPHSSVCVGPRRVGHQRTHGGKYCDRLLCLIVLAGLVVIAGSTVLPALAQPLDPESLIGVWSGRMTAMDDPSLNMKMVLTIERVAGGNVYGVREVYPRHGPVVSRPFRGTLEGNELRFGTWTLTVFPGRMTGHGRGGTGHVAARGGIDVELTKE